MAAQVSRELSRPVNRKAVRRVFKMLGWSEPTRAKREIIRADKKPPRPKAPNRFWESDMSYVYRGRLGLLLQRHRCLHQTVVGVHFIWPRHDIIMAVNNAVATAKPESELILLVDNGAQYTRYDFRTSVTALGIALEYIYVNTPEQNGHIKSFHRTLKIQCVWPREFAGIN